MALKVEIEKTLGSFHLEAAFETEAPGEILALLGASGCGKSMTLKCIAGIQRPDKGFISLNGRTLFDSAGHIDLPPQKRRVGFLFQNYALFPHMTVEQNLLAGVISGSRVERRAAVEEKLRAFRLEGLEKLRPAQLSGGQQQRAALARILVGRPELLLLDEPFSALDGHLKWQLELELADTLRSFPGGAVFVTHDRDEVYRLCDTVCVLNQGRSDPKVGVRQLFAAPATVGAALISGCKNISPARRTGEGLLECSGWGVTLRTALPVSEQTRYAGIRAHYFLLEEGPNPIPCRVERVIENLFSTVVMLRTPGPELLRLELEKERWAALAGREELTLFIRPEDVMPLTE